MLGPPNLITSSWLLRWAEFTLEIFCEWCLHRLRHVHVQTVPCGEKYGTCEKRGKSLFSEVMCGLVLHLIGPYRVHSLFWLIRLRWTRLVCDQLELSKRRLNNSRKKWRVCVFSAEVKVCLTESGKHVGFGWLSALYLCISQWLRWFLFFSHSRPWSRDRWC